MSLSRYVGKVKIPQSVAGLALTLLAGCSGEPRYRPPTGPSDTLPSPPVSQCPTGTPVLLPRTPVLPCPDSVDVSDIGADIALVFEAEPSQRPEIVCGSTTDPGRALSRRQERAFQALLLMRRLRFDSPLPWTSLSLYDWFRTTVAGVRFRSDISASFCCAPARVINIKYPGDPYDGETSLPGWPLQVLVHEARHIEAGGHPCGGTKDDRVDDLGAFGVQYHLLRFMADHETSGVLSSPYQAYARSYAEGLRASAFCTEC